MRPLDLDFARSRQPRAGWILLGLALFAAFDTGVAWRELTDKAAALQSLDARAAARTTAEDPRGEGAARAADRVAKSLLLPWDSLFRTLEQATGDQVALLALQPDARKREIAISGEAKDYDAVLAFVARLDERKTLHGVHLVRHELREDDPQRPMAFSILASWEGAP